MTTQTTWTTISKREARGRKGMVATKDVHATSAGIEILEAGGNAIDAAVAACFAEGTTVIRDASELRVKESDRIQVMADGLAALGFGSIEVGTVTPRPQPGMGTCPTHGA